MKKIISLVLFFFVLSLTPSPTYGSYDAGYSKGWPNTTDGGKGKVIKPFYKIPPDSYHAGEKISLQFSIENPENNTQEMTHALYLQIWKIEKANADTESFAEEKLYQNHNSKNDTQSLYKILPVGELSLLPGESSQFSTTVVISDGGYYQFDLTDLTDAQGYVPGHIYTAGFLRVKTPTEKGVLGIQTNESSIWAKLLPVLVGSLALAVILFFIWKKLRKKKEELAPVRKHRYFFQ